jgi:hypothetical protein
MRRPTFVNATHIAEKKLTNSNHHKCCDREIQLQVTRGPTFSAIGGKVRYCVVLERHKLEEIEPPNGL